jgi:hypothetical protein
MRGIGLVALWLLLKCVLSCSHSFGAEASTNLVQFRGMVAPISGSTNLEFRVQSGPVYRVLPTRDARALFMDTNLLHRTLLLKGKVKEKEQTVEVVGNLHSINKGKVYELDYWCDICSISTSIPGPCLCCREPVVPREQETNRKRDH